MGKPAARVGDFHVCPLSDGPKPHGGGPVNPPGAPTVQIGGQPAARLGDFATCVGPIDAIAMGCPTVLIGRLMAARMGDMSAHGGTLMVGMPTVQIGEAGTGPGGLPITRLPDGRLQIGNAIFVEGDPRFQAMVINRLALVASTASGMRTLLSIDGSGRRLTIVEFTGPNSFAAPDDWEAATAHGAPVYDGSGQPINSWLGLGPQLTGTGAGSDSTLQYNPNLTLPNPSDPANPMPNDAVLFHEMTHASHQMNGDQDCHPEPGWDTAEEQRTISTGAPSEADYLRERGYPWQRTDHDSTFAPNP
jgi:uncharacterized Zn-binding protein involved in type VI secretion